jgi:hypothetical protein
VLVVLVLVLVLVLQAQRDTVAQPRRPLGAQMARHTNL